MFDGSLQRHAPTLARSFSVQKDRTTQTTLRAAPVRFAEMNGREVETHKPILPPEKKFMETVPKRPNGVQRVAANGPFPFRGFRVTVHNLAPTVTWRDLKDFLRSAGEVRFADVVAPGTGIGEFGTPQERTNVIRLLDGKELKGNRIMIKHLNEMDPRFQGARPFQPYGQNFFQEPVTYAPTPGPAFDPPYALGFEVYPYNGGGPVMGQMEYPPPVPFGPPPPRLSHWGQSAGRVGRGYPPFTPAYPHNAASFPRGHIRPEGTGWGFPPAPPRPCVPVRSFERPPPVPYSQPAPPLRTPEFIDPPEDPSYPRHPAPTPGFVEPPAEPVPYETRAGTDRDYRTYSSGRYHAPLENREKPKVEYNGTGDDWRGYCGYRCEARTESERYSGKYDPPPPSEKPDPSHTYTPYPPLEDPRVEYPDYSRSLDDSRKDYSRSGSYSGYWDSASYPKSSAEPVVEKYDYAKSRVDSEAYKYRMGDYSRRDGYPSADYPKEHHRSTDYDYSRTEPRYTTSDYKSKESAYYDRRSGDHADSRSYRDEDPRGAGGAERTRQRSSHRTGPYER